MNLATPTDPGSSEEKYRQSRRKNMEVRYRKIQQRERELASQTIEGLSLTSHQVKQKLMSEFGISYQTVCTALAYQFRSKQNRQF
ncbi:hypothetical protein [Tunicatimonas pelagia]|uniref:hypothetical protein n=1 Tax=Tunicatimonas pelagia TaxID=931531 RepID=UPI002665F2A5|nr:hypothetical protein [Tunicatimonas pelagia]WKN42206.1 hypothetical protein P0M28_24520 [Tunicatimonas pelagia]WKN45324.1 hypothetical protein P0M28_10170 [Tunicatimonas pelagia]